MALLDDSSHGDSISRVMGLLEEQMTAGSYQCWTQGGAKLSRRFGVWTGGVGRLGGNRDGANRDLSALHVRRLQGISAPLIPPGLSDPQLTTLPYGPLRMVSTGVACGTSTILHQPTDLPCPDLPLSINRKIEDYWGSLACIAYRHPTLWLSP